MCDIERISPFLAEIETNFEEDKLLSEFRSFVAKSDKIKQMYNIKPLAETHRTFVDEQILKSWAGPFVVTNGILHDTRTHRGFVACDETEKILGYILFYIESECCEITVLESLCEKRGIGGALINAVVQVAKNEKCTRVWLVTTNDNTHAIRFYQRAGFSLCAVRIGAMKKARELKPQIPPAGFDEIPIEHEFEFEKLFI